MCIVDGVVATAAMASFAPAAVAEPSSAFEKAMSAGAAALSSPTPFSSSSDLCPCSLEFSVPLEGMSETDTMCSCRSPSVFMATTVGGGASGGSELPSHT